MSWIAVLIIAGVIAAYLLLRSLTQISVKSARAHLQQGALLVDVRTNAEFQSHHLPNALHIPLEELEPLVARRVKDKNQVLLVHCESGMRSQTARRKLTELGYTQTFNLGSYARAERIVGHR